MYTKEVNHIVEKEAKLLYMYSGHDTSIATILGSLNMFNGLAPPYASALLFELFAASVCHGRQPSSPTHSARCPSF